MGVVIDSSVFVAAERGLLDLGDRLAQRASERAAISAITVSELLHGVHRAAPAGIKNRREAFVEHILSTIEVLPFDEVAARTHARLWAGLAAKGTNIGPHDLIIAATAVVHACAVATRDQKSFPKIPGLSVEVWE